MSHYKPYPVYKDSGVEWIGKVPEHWEAIKIARLGSLTKANGGSKQDNVDSGIPCIRYGDLYTTHEYVIRGSRSYISSTKLDEYSSISYGDALFAASGETFEDIGRSAVSLLREEACCGGDVIVLRPTINLDPLFLGYALDSVASKAQKALMGKGYTVVHIYADQLRDLIVALPPLPEQESVGVVLNRETARIDALIAKKTEFIELLAKKRQALITHAVTKGLNPNVKMKDSGVEWIGDVPEHWEVKPIKFIASCNDDALPESASPATVIQYVDISSVSHDEGITGTETMLFGDAPSRARRKAMCGDVIVSTVRTYLKAVASVDELHADCVYSTGFAVLRAREGHLLPKFLKWLILNDLVIQAIESHSEGLSYPAINASELINLRVAVPGMFEQEAIAKYIDLETSRISRLIERIQDSIDLLKKRRSALITAAVTGQIDLRESA